MGGGASLTRFTALPESIDLTLFFKLTDEFFLEQDKKRSNKVGLEFVPEFNLKSGRYKRGFSDDSFSLFCDRNNGTLISSKRLLDIMASSDCYCSYDIGYDIFSRSNRKRVDEIIDNLVLKHELIISIYEGNYFNQLTNEPVVNLRDKISLQQKNSSCLLIFITKKYCEQINYSYEILKKTNSSSIDYSSSSSTFHANENNMTHQLFIELDEFMRFHGEYKVLPVLMETSTITPDMGIIYDYFKNHTVVQFSHNFGKENSEEFENSIQNLFQNIKNMIKLLKYGGNFLIKNIHQSNTTEGKLVTWLQSTVQPSIDPVLAEKYAMLMNKNSIENIFKLAHRLKFNDKLLEEIGIPKHHSELIKEFIIKDLNESLDTKKLAVADNYLRKKKEIEQNLKSGIENDKIKFENNSEEIDSNLLLLIENEKKRTMKLKENEEKVSSFLNDSNYFYENSCMKKEDELSKNFNSTFALKNYIKVNNKKSVLYNSNIDKMMKKHIVHINKYNKRNLLNILDNIKNQKLTNIKTIIESYNTVLECSNYFIYLYEKLLEVIRTKDEDDDYSDSDSEEDDDGDGEDEDEFDDDDDDLDEEDETNFLIESDEENKCSKSVLAPIKPIDSPNSRPTSRERNKNTIFTLKNSLTPEISKKLASSKKNKLNSTSTPKELVVNNLITSSFVNINSAKQNKPSNLSKNTRFFQNVLPYSESIGHKAVELSPQIPKRKKKFLLILYEVGLILRKIEFFCFNSLYHCKEFAACNVIKLLLTMLARIYPYHLVFLLPESIQVNDVLKKFYHKIEFPNQFFLTLSMILSPGISRHFVQTDQILLLNRYGVLKISTDLLKFYFLNLKVLCKLLKLIVINISNNNNLLRRKLVKNIASNRNFFMILKLIFDRYCSKNSKNIGEIDFYIIFIYAQCAFYYGTSKYRQNILQIPILFISKLVNNMIIFLGEKGNNNKINISDFNLWYPNNEKLIYYFSSSIELIFYYPVREFIPHHDLSVNQIGESKKTYKFMTRDLKSQVSEYNLMTFIFSQLENFFEDDFAYDYNNDINLEDSRYTSSQLKVAAEKFCLGLVNSVNIFPTDFSDSLDGIPTKSYESNSELLENADSLNYKLRITMITKLFNIIINAVYLRNDLKVLYLKQNKGYLLVVIFFYFHAGIYFCKKVTSYCSLGIQILTKCCLVLSNLILILDEEDEEFPLSSFIKKIIDEYHLIEILMEVWAYSRSNNEFQNAVLILVNKLIQNTNYYCSNHLILVGFLEKFLYFISSNKNPFKYNKIELLYSILNKFLNFSRRTKDLRLNSDQRIIKSKNYTFETFSSQAISNFCLNNNGPHWSHFSSSFIIYTQYNEANSPEAHANIFTMDIEEKDFSNLVQENEDSKVQSNSIIQTSLELNSQVLPQSESLTLPSISSSYSNPYSKSYLNSKSKLLPPSKLSAESSEDEQVNQFNQLNQYSSITFNPSIESSSSMTNDKYFCTNSAAYSNICRSCLMTSCHLSLIYSSTSKDPSILKRIHETKLPFQLKNSPKVFNTENDLIVNNTIIQIRERFLDEKKKDPIESGKVTENSSTGNDNEKINTLKEKKKRIYLLPPIPLYLFYSNEVRENLTLFPDLNIELVYNIDYEEYYHDIEQLIDDLNL